jgi:hypothetical protein
MAHYLETTKSGIVESLLVRPVIYPSGKPRIPHLPASAGSDDLRYQGFGVKYYSLTLDALDLRHLRLLQR